MGSVTTRTPRLKVAVRLSPAGVAAVDELAAAEDRTRSDMVRVLLVEAINARRERQDQ